MTSFASDALPAVPSAPDLGAFAIGFDERDRPRLHALWDEILTSQRWTEGPLTEAFEQAWGERHGVGAVALGGWTGGALAALRFAGVGAGDVVLCPSNTFMATPLAAIHAGARVEFVDCNRDDLCMSFASFERAVEQHKPKAAFLVHIGGHIAFDVERIAGFTANHRKSGARASLSDYYTAAYGRAVFNKSLKDHIVFSDHSLATDGVFAEVQLVSCRNVLIYFNRVLQDRAIGLFREALCRQGFIGIGAKESLRFSSHSNAFLDFVPDERIFQKRAEL